MAVADDGIVASSRRELFTYPAPRRLEHKSSYLKVLLWFGLVLDGLLGLKVAPSCLHY